MVSLIDLLICVLIRRILWLDNSFNNKKYVSYLKKTFNCSRQERKCKPCNITNFNRALIYM